MYTVKGNTNVIWKDFNEFIENATKNKFILGQKKNPQVYTSEKYFLKKKFSGNTFYEKAKDKCHSFLQQDKLIILFHFQWTLEHFCTIFCLFIDLLTDIWGHLNFWIWYIMFYEPNYTMCLFKKKKKKELQWSDILLY